ncbi:MAG: beta-N-acetylhexosaminidase [Proteobacteria bacterium]|nr:beta-N-acetylhexosaminidase [Pseudomonadota bacterium]
MYGNSIHSGNKQSLGFLMIGISGLKLTEAEIKQLLNPAVAGVVLFRRNYDSPEQLRALTSEIHSLRHPRLLVSVDHEGGRVQRFKTAGFTALPAMKQLGDLHDTHPQQAVHLAFDLGWLLATELLSCGVDFSFAPVLDLDYGNSSVIGDRAFHHNPMVISQLADALMQGMANAGMTGVAKHFPGHGYALADTHYDMAIDARELATLVGADMMPFKYLIERHCGAIMVAHVVYPQVDTLPAGLSTIWLKQMLRERCGYTGAIISDDIGMAAVANLADGGELASKFYQAGCDLVLLCNDQTQISSALTRFNNYDADPIQESRLIRLHGKPKQHYSGLQALQKSAEWLSVMKKLASAHLVTFEHNA